MGFQLPLEPHQNWRDKTPNTGSIQFESCEQGAYLPLFRPLPSGSLRGLRRIYILLGVIRIAKRPTHSKRTSENVEEAKSWAELTEAMDDLPSPFVPEILPNPINNATAQVAARYSGCRSESRPNRSLRTGTPAYETPS